MGFSKPGLLAADSEARKMPRWSAPASFSGPLQFRTFYLMTVFTLLYSFACLNGVNAQTFGDTLDYVTVDRERNCVENFNVEAEIDYFQDKITDFNDADFTITYNNYYKVIKNVRKNVIYIAYLCGTQVPDVSELGEVVPVEIPPVSYGVGSQTLMIPLLHLGALDGLEFNPSTQRMPDCVDESQVVTPESYCYDDCVKDAWAQTPVDILFDGSTVPAPAEDKVSVVVSDLLSVSAEDVSNWITFIGAFLNRDAVAKQVAEDQLVSAECITSSAEIAAEEDQPNFMFLTYFDPGTKKFLIGYCPNYYCSHAGSAGGKVIETADLIGDFTQNEYFSVDRILKTLAHLNRTVDHLVLFQNADTQIGTIEGPDSGDNTYLTVLINGIIELQGVELTVYDVARGDDWFFANKQLGLVVNDFIKIVSPNGALSDSKFYFFDQYYPENKNVVAEADDLFSATCPTVDSSISLNTEWAPEACPNLDSAAPSMVIGSKLLTMIGVLLVFVFTA